MAEAAGEYTTGAGALDDVDDGAAVGYSELAALTPLVLAHSASVCPSLQHSVFCVSGLEAQ